MKSTKRFKDNASRLAWFMPVLLSVLMAACGGDGGRDPILGMGKIVQTVPVPPTVTAVVPDNNVFDVAINDTLITATFSEAMAPITGGASFVITCFAPCVNPTGTVALDVTNTIATYTLDAPLTPLTAYVVTITAAESLVTGATMASPYEWHFTTGATPDVTQPTVTLTAPVTTLPLPTPTPDAPTNAAITAVFSEDMVEASVTAPGVFTLTCELPCVSPVAGTVTYSVGNQTATFTPDVDLDVSTTYTATIAATVTDIALNGLAGNQLPAPPAASAYIWTFTTAAALPPQIISVDDLSIVPDANAVGVCPTRAIQATFVVPSLLRMSDATVNSMTFTVTGPGPLFTPVQAASVVLDNATGTIATFTPMEPLTEGVTYIVTIKGGISGVKDAAIPGNEMTVDYTWEFTAGPPTGVCIPAVDLGVIATFGIAATAGVTNTGATTINGNVVLDPTPNCNFVQIDAAGGFGLCGGSPPTINGLVISPLYPDAGSTSGAVKADLLAVFLSITPPAGPPAAGSMNMAGVINLPAATTLGDSTGSAEVLNDNLFYPGLYQSLTSILITGDIMLDAQGDVNAVFIFQSSSSLGTAAGAMSPGAHTRILLRNGAKASNVWWQVGSSATLGTHTEFAGNILASESITMETGAISCGRLLAGAFTAGAFVFDSNVVSVPGNGCPE